MKAQMLINTFLMFPSPTSSSSSSLFVIIHSWSAALFYFSSSVVLSNHKSVLSSLFIKRTHFCIQRPGHLSSSIVLLCPILLKWKTFISCFGQFAKNTERQLHLFIQDLIFWKFTKQIAPSII